MSSQKLMTPAEIERATVERCANLCEVRAGYHAGGNEFRQWESKDCADAIRALPPMFGDVPVACPYPCGWKNLYSYIVSRAAYVVRSIDSEEIGEEVYKSIIDLIHNAKTLCEFGMKLTAPAASQAAAKDVVRHELATDVEMLDFLESQAKKSRTGVSVEYVNHPGERGEVPERGFRVMWFHKVHAPQPTIRAAIDAAMAAAPEVK